MGLATDKIVLPKSHMTLAIDKLILTKGKIGLPPARKNWASAKLILANAHANPSTGNVIRPTATVVATAVVEEETIKEYFFIFSICQ